jgi:hypothetical protein
MFEKPLVEYNHKIRGQHEDFAFINELNAPIQKDLAKIQGYSIDMIDAMHSTYLNRMCRCDIGQGKDYSTKIFFDKLRGNTWIECKNEDNFIQPSHLKRMQPCTKQIPSWGGKLYTMPKEEGMKLAPKIKAKRAWEIL